MQPIPKEGTKTMAKKLFRELAAGGLHSHYQISLKGVINPDCVYTLDAFKELTGLGDAALRRIGAGRAYSFHLLS